MPDDVIDILSDMIRINSENYMNACDKTGDTREEPMADYLDSLLAALGMEVKRQYMSPGRPNVYGFHSCGKQGAKTLCLNAHLDTVGTRGMTIPPFEPVLEDGCIYGRGSCDTKGSLAAMVKACEQAISQKLPVNLLLLATVGEESGNQGATLSDLTPYHVDGVIVGEATENRPVIAHKSSCRCEIYCDGVAAHSSRPELGDNAILKMGRVLCFLNDVIIPELKAIRYPYFETGCTCSPNLISGGTKDNIVADRCSITCNLRLLPEAGDPEALFQSIVDRATRALGFPVKLGYTLVFHPMHTDPQSPFAQVVCKAVSSHGIDATPQSAPYGTDGGVFSHRGYPCLVLGPGNIKYAHAKVEKVPVAQVRQAAAIYADVARLMAGQP